MNQFNIVKMVFGSHLYGTDSEKSDKDFKGIFMPSQEQVFLGKIPKCLNNSTKHGDQKNTPTDIDTEIYSLHYFIHLACEGETVALDMLHAPPNMIIEKHSIWDEIVHERGRFYTKNLKAFVGYARRQASKYGVKGSRLNEAAKVISFFSKCPPGNKISSVWSELPTGEHIYKKEDLCPKIYEVCGRQMQETATINYGQEIIQRFHANYGARAEQAARNEGIDWKAVSHALRAAFQVKELLTKGTIIFPLEQAGYLKKVKSGSLHYNEVAPELDSLISEIEVIAANSNLPLRAERTYWDKFIIRAIEKWTL